jgi:biopolymer transport protein ExbB
MWQILKSGGWVMIPLLLCSLTTVTIVVERWLFFRRIITSTHQADALLQFVKAGKIDEAMEIAEVTEYPVVKVLGVGMKQRHVAVMDRVMEAAGRTEIAMMKRGLPTLETIITLSPMLGLLGTILGIMDSFRIMSIVSGEVQTGAVTGGVAEALVSTAAGIVVAVATLVPYNYFMARIEKETGKIEQYATDLEMTLKIAPQG